MMPKSKTDFLKSITFTTETGIEITVVPEYALAIPMDDEPGGVMLQIPVFVDGVASHIVLTPEELARTTRNPLFGEAMRVGDFVRRRRARER